ncbi:MAG: hypothetical protein KF856_18580 [Cyclobacteriaceae bacterium]|nr:hypothetical protein [Cyclobacteriaceae bacterium]
MDLTAFMKKYADQIGGQFTQYDPSHSIIIMPVSGNRFQTVIGTIKKTESSNRSLITLASKICASKPSLDYKKLLEQAVRFSYSRFIITDNYLQLEAIAPVDTTTESTLSEMLQEVANLADQYELQLTDSDIH